ncbi:MAG: flagellar basal body P-ring formation chaperone FlgA [Lentisphaeraceae bacterium]|nr:flagellar basal body P-ring formation chaperone FlgA [Lentisphaeraceae bacterium]
MTKFSIILMFLFSVMNLHAERTVKLKKTVQVSGSQVLLEDLLIDSSDLKEEEKSLVILKSPIRGFKNFRPVDIAYEMQLHESLLDLSLEAPPFVKIIRIKDINFVETFKAYLKARLNKETPWKMFELEIEFSPSDITTITSMSGCDYEMVSQRANDELNGAKVTVKFTENGSSRGAVKLEPIIRRKILAITLKTDLTKGKIIQKSDLILDRVWVSGTDERFATNFVDCIGFEAGRNMSAGSRVVKAHLIEPVYVQKGDFLKVSSESSFLRITIDAKALSMGRRGEVIRVKNIKSGRLLDVVMTGIQTAVVK